VASNVVGRDIAWRWLNDEWSAIHEFFDNAISSPVSSMINSVTSDFNTEADLTELLNFYQTKKHELGTALKTTQKALVNTVINIRWMENHYEGIRKWVLDNLPEDDDETTTTTTMTTTTGGDGNGGDGENGAGTNVASILAPLIALSVFAVLR
jgi:hypothetical protein